MNRPDSLTSWHADWSGLRVVVLGLSMTGFAVADTLAELGADVLVTAEDAEPDYRRLVPVLGAELLIGPPDVEAVASHGPELVVASPGFPPDHPLIRWARTHAIPVWGDLELAWRVRDKIPGPDGRPAPWMLVTGTNGKTTTTRLAAAMLQESGLRAVPCGNIGVPVLDAVRDPAGADILVVEVSSHQLWYLSLQTGPEPVSPYASVCLNLAPDHLTWHGTFDEYRDAKAQVYQNTAVACVYNLADDATRKMVEDADVIEGARAIGFGLGVPGSSEVGVVDGILVDRAFLAERATSALELATLDDLAAAGLTAPHLVMDVLAAAALARSAGAPPARIRTAVRRFRLDPHRIQTVAVIGSVTWVDDSKATNPHAAASSLRAYPGAIWIVGGQLKGVDVSELVAGPGSGVKAAIVIGVDRSEVVAAFARHAPAVPLFEVAAAETEDVMARVVELAAQLATEGDVVLLAPAAASFDQFSSYADRGRRYADAVQERFGGDAGGGHDADAPGEASA